MKKKRIEKKEQAKEEDVLVKAGYSVKIGYREIPGNAKGKKEYVVEYWEKEHGKN